MDLCVICCVRNMSFREALRWRPASELGLYSDQGILCIGDEKAVYDRLRFGRLSGLISQVILFV